MIKRYFIKKSIPILLVLTLSISLAGDLWNSNVRVYADSAVTTPKTVIGGLAGINWNVFKTDTIEKLSIDVSVSDDIDPSLNLYICALGGKLSNVGFYCGIQTNTLGFISKKNQGMRSVGKGAIFSRWGERDLSAVSIAAGGKCQTAGYEGDFVGVRNAYVWNKGLYNIELKVIKSGFCIPEDNQNTWMGMFIYSYADKTNTYMGAIRFPGTTLKLEGGWLYSFVEIYGNPISTSQVPNRTIGFSNLRINDNIVQLTVANIGYQENTNNTGKAIVTDKELQVSIGPDVNDPSKYDYTYSGDGSSWFENLDVSHLTYPNAVAKPDVTDNLDPIQKPKAPTVKTDLKNIYLQWNEPQDAQKSGVIGYNVYRDTGSYIRDSDPINNEIIKELSFVDENISRDKTYNYYITAVNKYEIESTASDKVEIKTNSVERPKGLKAKKVGNKIILHWDKPSKVNTSDIIGYYIYKGISKGKEALIPINKQLVKSTDYVDINISKNKTYYYTVKAIDKNKKYSSPSDEAIIKINQ